MNLLYDHQIFVKQQYGGVSRIFVEIIKHLREYPDVKIELPLLYSHNTHLVENNFHPTKPYLQRPFKGRTTLMNSINVLNNFYTNKQLRKQNFDVFHPTYYDTYFLSALKQKPFVLTIYDMTHEKMAHQELKTDKTIEYKQILAHKATHIIAISENTKKDIHEIYGISEQKITVSYLDNSLKPVVNYSPELKFPDFYILFVGNRRVYKNFDLFLDAVAPLLKENNDLHLVCAGGAAFNSAEEHRIQTLGIKKQVVQTAIPDNLLAHLYQNAQCFVFPSLYEGFGIPTLEAFACECPVALSYASSMPEVGGDAALYFDPNSKESIFQTVQKIIYDRDLQNQLRAKGREQLQKFSWQQSARQHYELYKNL